MRNAVHFGAGNIGRGFIGYLLSLSGYHVIFADIDEELIDSINKNKKYLVEIVGENIKRKYVENISAVNSLDKKLINEISRTSIITTAVGPKVLEKIAPTIALGIQEKYNRNNKNYLNIIPCENMIGAADYLKKQVEKYLNEKEVEFLNSYVGFVNSAVDRIVPPIGDKRKDITHVVVEEFSEWIVDETKFKGNIPKIKSMECTDNLIAYTERKIFTLNTGHAITAYLGYLNNCNTIRESILNPAIKKVVLGAMRESGKVLIYKYGFDPREHEEYIMSILSRFNNPFLKDSVTRVARQPLRKLSYDERLIKPLRGTIKYNLENINLIKGIAAAISYDYDKDEDVAKIQKIMKENNIDEAIQEITGLNKDLKEVRLIREQYFNLNKRAD